MICDVDDLVAGTLTADVCLVGAGAAGIAIATELDGCGARVLLLESGRRELDPRTQALYEGRVAGLPHGGIHGYRYRVFGGSTTRWAGQALPLAPIDFARREWVPGSGWPLAAAELEPHYRRAAELMRIPPFGPDSEHAWPAALATPPRFDPALVRARFSEFSPKPDFAGLFGVSLEASANVEVVLGANVTELVPDPAASGLDFLLARSLRGRVLEVRAAHFVLCAGGLEVPRLLLSSERRCEGGVGNSHDLVGRCFQDHAGIEVGEVVPRDRARWRRAFRPRRAGGVKYAPLFSAAEELQRRERIVNAAGLITFGGRAASDVAAKTLLRALRRSGLDAHGRAEAAPAARALLRDPAPPLRAAARRFLLRQPGFDTSGTPTLVSGGEQAPNPRSRVFLGTERDELGMRRLVLDWRVTELDLRSWRRFAEVVAAEFERLGWGRVELELGRLPEDPDAVTGLVDSGHHMGTARMSADPASGVVDAGCRVHGFENLWIAGSAVFPTGGFSNPTFTILALALRLAEELRARVGSREAVGAA